MRKLAFLALGIVAAAGCSTASEKPRSVPLPTTGVTSEQLDAFSNLETKTNQQWVWIQHDNLGTPMHVSTERTGAAVLAPGDDIRSRTIGVLTEHKALWKMQDPSNELSAVRAETDDYAMQHVRFQQMVHGVPVSGAEVSAHYDDQGRLTSIDANYVSDLAAIDVNPRFSAADALSMVKADILGRMKIDEGQLEPDAGKLVIHARNGVNRLAYEYRVRALAGSEPAIWVISVDAQTGDILNRYNNLQTVTASGKGVLGDTKTFEVAQSGSGFVMDNVDSSTGVELQTFSAATQEVAPGDPVTSSSATSWDTAAPGPGAAVDAHVNAGVVAKYYKNVHNRNAIDNQGSPLISTVHFGTQFDNAAWVAPGMIYGDGGTLFRALSVGVDVVGHEFTHGVTEKTSALNYQDQSGALNEAVSDIFGAFIEHSVKADNTKNWQIGEMVTLNAKPLRDMMSPNNVDDPQPAHMQQFVQTTQDSGGVHINSGVINNAAWLMTMSGTNPVSRMAVKYGIGWDKSEKLWYQANSHYFMTTTNFAQAAAALQSAGKDVGLTTNELAIVDCSFKATGVISGSCATLTQPASTTSGTSSGSSSSSSSSSNSSGDDDDSSDKPKKVHLVTTTESACNVAPGGGPDFGLVAGVLGVLAALGGKRRRKNK